MYRVMAVAAAAVAVLVVAVAQAADPTDPATRSAFEARAAKLEERLEARSAGGASISARGKRGPRGPRGARGPRGITGPKGATGPKGTFGSVIAVDGPKVTLCSEVPSCAVQGASAPCPPGTVVVGGGWKGGGIETFFTWSAPVGNAWNIIAVNWYGTPQVNAVAMCAAP